MEHLLLTNFLAQFLAFGNLLVREPLIVIAADAATTIEIMDVPARKAEGDD
jgi:hypothetical protein